MLEPSARLHRRAAGCRRAGGVSDRPGRVACARAYPDGGTRDVPRGALGDDGETPRASARVRHAVRPLLRHRAGAGCARRADAEDGEPGSERGVPRGAVPRPAARRRPGDPRSRAPAVSSFGRVESGAQPARPTSSTASSVRSISTSCSHADARASTTTVQRPCRNGSGRTSSRRGSKVPPGGPRARCDAGSLSIRCRACREQRLRRRCPRISSSCARPATRSGTEACGPPARAPARDPARDQAQARDATAGSTCARRCAPRCRPAACRSIRGSATSIGTARAVPAVRHQRLGRRVRAVHAACSCTRSRRSSARCARSCSSTRSTR